MKIKKYLILIILAGVFLFTSCNYDIFTTEEGITVKRIYSNANDKNVCKRVLYIGDDGYIYCDKELTEKVNSEVLMNFAGKDLVTIFDASGVQYTPVNFNKVDDYVVVTIFDSNGDLQYLYSSEYPEQIVPGLYDEEGNMIVSWEDCGIDIENERTGVDVKTDPTSGYYIFTFTYPNAVKIVIPENISRIGNKGFKDCSNLKEVSFVPGSTCTYISDAAFSHCENLEKIEIPSSISEIDMGAFNNCDNIDSVYITDISAWCAIRFIGAAANPLNENCKLYINNEEAVNVIIPNTTESIKDYAFADYANLQTVSFEETSSCESIGLQAFARCTNLESIGLPASINSIDAAAFSRCGSLESIVFPENITEIADSVLDEGTSLKSITIPSTVTTIDSGAFYACQNLETITFLGTTVQWEAITKNEEWDLDTGAYVVHCTDGDLPKE